MPPPVDLDALAATVAQMTQGEWRHIGIDRFHEGDDYVRVIDSPADGDLVVTVATGVMNDDAGEAQREPKALANAIGIVALVNAAPALIQMARTLETVYAEIAKLPSPIHQSDLAGWKRCAWCRADLEHDSDPHEPDCLWARALAALDAAREEPTR